MFRKLYFHWPVWLAISTGFLIRLGYSRYGYIIFGNDQARDAFTVSELLSGDIKIQGPPTSTRDFFHGVLFYYLAAPGYWLGHGDPRIATAWLSLISCLGIAILYVFSWQVWHNRFLSAFITLLFAVSYEQVQFGTYLANTFFGSVSVPILYLGLWRWQKNLKWGPALAGLGWGLSVQSNIFLLYHLPVVLAMAIFKKIKLSKPNIVNFLTLFIISTSSIMISELKFGLPSRYGLFRLLSRSDYQSLNVTLPQYLSTLASFYRQIAAHNLVPQLPSLSLALAILLVISGFWLLPILGLASLVLPLTVGGIGSPYMTVGLASLLFMLLGRFLYRLNRYPGVITTIVIILIVSQLSYHQDHRVQAQSEFSIQKSMTLANQMAALDYMYAESRGQPFSVNSITVPLFSNTTWSYLFNWYGRVKYGYLPFWHGRDQIGQLGNNLVRPPTRVNRYFMIIEPRQGLPSDLVDKILEEEKGYSTFNHQRQFGEITIQNRSAVSR